LELADEYYVDPKTGEITQIEISGGKLEGFLTGKAWISAEYITTLGHDVIVAQKGSENSLTVADKGLSETVQKSDALDVTPSLRNDSYHHAVTSKRISLKQPLNPLWIRHPSSFPKLKRPHPLTNQFSEIPITKEPLG